MRPTRRSADDGVMYVMMVVGHQVDAGPCGGYEVLHERMIVVRQQLQLDAATVAVGTGIDDALIAVRR